MKLKGSAKKWHNVPFGITEGKEYEVLGYLGETYYIIDDRGVHASYHRDWFEGVEEKVEEQPNTIDSHYSFDYVLKASETVDGVLKVDPYFVANTWRLGEKDNSGVIFHILKTCARFGEKNRKEREIKAIYKSIKRLAELEGIDLES